MTRFALGTFLSLLLITSSVSADAISRPPEMCPEGSTALDFCHGPPTCDIADCTGDGDCTAGQVCAPRDLCVREHCCSGRGCESPDAPRYDHITGPCTGGTCAEFGTACETRRVCVARPPGTDAGPADVDSGPADVDSGPADSDSGPADSDSGPADSDSGPAGTDSGPAGTDAGGAGTDGGSDAGDGGGGTDGGCGCSSVGSSPGAPIGAGIMLFGLSLLVGRRRRG